MAFDIQQLNGSYVLPIVKKLVQYPSVIPGSDEFEVASYVKTFMEDLHIPVEVIPISERRFNVVARIKGQNLAAPIAFNGHMDVVPVNETERRKWKSDPFSPWIEDGFLYGRGTSDMKGGLGAAMAAMQFLQENHIQPPGDVVLVATVDEEDIMRGAKALINTACLQDIKNMIICEPSDMQLMFCSRGRTWADVTVKGESGHASIEGNGNNAILQAFKLMQAVNTHIIPAATHSILGKSFWQITVIHGGVEPAMVPDTCVVTVDARLVPGQTTQEIWRQLDHLLEELHQQDSRFQASLQIIESRNPWETSLESPLAQLIKHCCQQTNLPEHYSGFLATADGAVFSRLAMDMAIIGPGTLEKSHQQNECVAICQLEQAAQLYLTLMLQNNIPFTHSAQV